MSITNQVSKSQNHFVEHLHLANGLESIFKKYVSGLRWHKCMAVGEGGAADELGHMDTHSSAPLKPLHKIGFLWSTASTSELHA